MACPILEALYEGTRGGGKTDCLLMDYGQHVGQGYGPDWRGILFRETYPQLGDVITKSLRWFSVIFPKAKYNRATTTWTFPEGEELLFRHMAHPDDYWKYHGHSYQWIAFEELTNWASSDCYLRMFSTLRSSRADVPRKMRATTNPYGPGHGWVKERFRLPAPVGRTVGNIIRDARAPDGSLEPPRVSIRSMLAENRILLTSDPDYIQRLRASAENEAQLEAWLAGSWDIVSGGMFNDRWEPRAHIIPDFAPALIPRTWKINRSYDHGQSKPFSVGWWAESNGEPFTAPSGRVLGHIRGDLFRIDEWYGWNGHANQGCRMSSFDIGTGIMARENDWGLAGRVLPGPADSSIFDVQDPTLPSVAAQMASAGVSWTWADKRPGTRKLGWQEIRDRLKAAATYPREHPGIFVLERCKHFIRTIPTLPRDRRDPDDLDTNAEDHIADEMRYRVREGNNLVRSGSF